MTKTLKLTLASLFMVIVYLLLPVLVKFYTDWVIDKNIILIIIITIATITIPRIILNYIPIVIGKLTTNKYKMLQVASIINWIARILYLAFIFFITDLHNTKSIIISAFMCLLFYAFSNFFSHGIVHHVLIQGDNEDEFTDTGVQIGSPDAE